MPARSSTVVGLKEVLDLAKGKGKATRVRSARTGRFVRPWIAEKFPNATVVERVKK